MAYQTLSRIGKVIGVNTMTLSGALIITRIPASANPGDNVILGATVKNTGTTNNNSFVILINVADANGVLVTSGETGNMTLLIGQTSLEFTLVFTMPNSAVAVAFEAQADPNFNY